MEGARTHSRHDGAPHQQPMGSTTPSAATSLHKSEITPDPTTSHSVNLMVLRLGIAVYYITRITRKY